MLLSNLLTGALLLTPTFVSAAIFPSGTLVKMIDAKEFNKALKENVCVFKYGGSMGTE